MLPILFAKLSGAWTTIKIGFSAFRFLDKWKLRKEGAERERAKAMRKVIERTKHAKKIRHTRNPADRSRVRKFDRKDGGE